MAGGKTGMAGSGFGTIFRITTWGESHGKALGVVIDGCPAGLALKEADINKYMERRRPNAGKMSTKRKEPDEAEILSGVWDGRTTGTPISIIIKNEDAHSSDYSELWDVYRPGHADFGFDTKYGFRDARGGGRSSGRETSARVAAGAVALKLLSEIGISVHAEVESIGAYPAKSIEAEELITGLRKEGDSTGSTVFCCASGVPAGLGDPVFEKLDARLSSAIFSIGAVKAVEIGDGCAVSLARGSANNDPFRIKDGKIVTAGNHAGGILGGISNGSEILIRAYFKPTPSISVPQDTVRKDGTETVITVKGRHDPVIGPRAAVVVECMTGLVLADSLLLNMSSRVDRIRSFYGASDSAEDAGQ